MAFGRTEDISESHQKRTNLKSNGQNHGPVVSKNPTPSKEKLEKITTLETTTKGQRKQNPEDQEENVLIAGY